jgi:replicative DNA helicase
MGLLVATRVRLLSGTGRSAVAKSKSKTPKTIAGMKVPKALRKSGWLDPVLADPQTREILADMLIAAAGAAAAALVKERPSLRQVADAGSTVAEAGVEAGSAARDMVQGAASAAAGVITQAAKAILPDALTRPDDTPASSSAPKGKIKAGSKKRNGD